jgi:uncharacterized membrane protein
MNNNKTEPEPAAAGKVACFTRRILSHSEGRILFAGLGMALIYLAWLGLTFLISAEDFHSFVGMTVTHILFGRAAGIMFGFALDYGYAVVILVNVAIETIMVMLFYPFFVLSLRSLLIIGFMERLMNRINEAAEANKDYIRRFGIPGLFMFVFIPFWMTGPIVGCAIGFLLGMRPSVNLTVVLSGTYIAIFVWAVLLKKLSERISEYSVIAPWILVILIILMVFLGYIFKRKQP